jgi:uncharacterized damage-inducible protein DinB
VRHSLWANESWIAFISEKFPSNNYLLQRMSHILLGEQVWFQRIRGEVLNREIWRTMDLPQLKTELDRNRDSYHELLSHTPDRVIAYQRFTGEKYQSPVSDILLHLVLHGTHHRGQMATHVSTFGSTPINTDFIQFCLSQRL